MTAPATTALSTMAAHRLRVAVLAVTCLLSAALVLWSGLYFTSFTWKDSPDINPCEMSYFHLIHFPTPIHSTVQPSSPTYRHYSSEPQPLEQLPFASNRHLIQMAFGAGYRVLRYVEHGHDDSLLLGQPVLFLPGSSGNYHQSRSLFSRLNTLHRQLHPHSPSAPADPCDYYAVDLLEEKSAFSSALLLQQAHYVNDAIQSLLHLYHRAGRTNVTSVILVAHSMGGVVARLLPYLVNWQADSVRSLYTLGTPHAAPVLVTDKGMRAIYSHLAAEVRSAQLRVPVQLSVAGGVNDFFIEPALAALPVAGALAGVSNGLPHVQTSIEHHALCWCKQLMELTAALIERDAQRDNPSHPHHISHAHQLARFPPSPFQSPAHYVEVRMTTAHVRLELPGPSALVVIEGRVKLAQVCEGDEEAAQKCEDVTASLTDITTLYRDHPFPLPRSSTSMRSAIHIDRTASDGSSPLYLRLSKVNRTEITKFTDTKPVMSIAPATSSPASSLPTHLPAGVYRWQYYVPAGVDRYFALSLHSTSVAATSYEHPVFVHFSSIRAEGEASVEDEWHEDTFLSQLNVNTVVRYYRRPYARYATAFIALPPINSSSSDASPYRVNLSLSPYSYLRTLFLQLPIATHFLLSAFLFLIAAQHRVLNTQQRFPHIHQLLSFLSTPSLVLVFLSSFLLFALSCPGTQFHARAFYESTLEASAVDWPVLQLWTKARLWSAANSNETGVACFVLFLACVGVVAVIQPLLWLLLTALSQVASAVRRCGAAVPLPSVVLLAWRLVVLLFTVAVVTTMWFYVDAAVHTHFHVSVLTRLSPFIQAARDSLLSSLINRLHPLMPSSPLFFLFLIPDTVMLIAVFLLFLLVQACLWDRTRQSLCVYQLSCTTLALFAFLLTTPHLLTFMSLRGTPLSAPLWTVSALHLVLLVCCSAVPSQSPVLQPVVWLVYGVTLLFASDASMSLQSLYMVYVVVMLCYLPHAVRCSVAMVLDAFVALQGLPKTHRGHIE